MSTFKLQLLSYFIIIFLVINADQVLSGATVEQMRAAGKLMRDVCQPKFPKITDEIGDQIKIGNIPDTKDAKCYVNCILEMMQTMKKGKFQYESAMKQVDILLPDDYKDEYRVGLTKCKNEANGIKNHCDAALVIYMCTFAEITKLIFP